MAKEEKIYYPFAVKTRIKIVPGKRVIKDGEISHIPPVSFILERPAMAAKGFKAEEVVAGVKVKSGIEITAADAIKALDKAVVKGLAATSRGDFIAKTESPLTAAESYQVDTLSKQVAELKASDEAKGAENQKLAREVEELKAKLAAKR